MRAYFLSLEKNAWGLGLPGYGDLVANIRSESGHDNLEDSLQFSRHRILSFNYDCCFEMACMKNWPVDENTNLYSPTLLNTGMPQIIPNAPDWIADRFTYIKAHGSVKITSKYDPYEDSQYVHRFNSFVPWEKPIADQYFFSNDRKKLERIDSTIFFPCERSRLTGNEESVRPARNYAKNLIDRMKTVCGEASVIQFIGYSVSHQDVPYLREILADAKKCQKWEIHNKSQEFATVQDQLVNWLDVPEEQIKLREINFGSVIK